jgi:hypothetical protein
MARGESKPDGFAEQQDDAAPLDAAQRGAQVGEGGAVQARAPGSVFR